MASIFENLSEVVSSKETIEEEVFEITDFTTASEWERFTAAVEKALHEWELVGINVPNSAKCIPPGELAKVSWHEKNTTVKFSDFVFKVTYTFLMEKTSEEEEPFIKGEDYETDLPDALRDLMDDKNDFPSRAHCLVRWYGVRNFIVFSSALPSQIICSLARSKLVLSSLALAANNTNCQVPLFLQTMESSEKMYTGVGFGNGIRTDYEMIHVKVPPPQCTHLSGLLSIFKSKLGCTFESAPVFVSVRFTYIVSEWPHTSWMQQPPDFDAAFSSIGFSELGKLPFGALSDPISELQVSTTWLSMSEHVLVDGEIYSDLDPLSAPLWSARIGVANLPPCLLSEHLIEFLLLSRRDLSIIQILGPNFDPDVNDTPNIINALDRLTASPVSSVVPKVRLKHDAISKNFLGPIPEDLLNQLLNFIFPDDEEDEGFAPYPGTFNQVPPLNSFLIDVFEDHPLKNQLLNMKTCAYDSFIWRLAVVLCHVSHSLGGLSAVAHFYYEFLLELRFRWDNGIRIPGIPDGAPDLGSCLLQQKIQMLNCCIKKRNARDRSENTDDSVEDEEEFYDCDEADEETKGDYLPWDKPEGRLKKYENLKLLNGKEFLFVPLTQEAPPVTEDKLNEQEDELLRLGSDSSASQTRARMMSITLASDMEAFKAANPGSLLEDFIRWYSPRDWIEIEIEGEDSSPKNVKGHLSARMELPGNLWREVWEGAKPVPAKRQKRLFDDTREAESVLRWFNTSSPSAMCQQLLPVVVHVALSRISEEAVLYTLPTEKWNTSLPNVLHSDSLSAQLHLLAQRSVRLSRQPCDSSKYQVLIEQLGTIESAISKAQSLRYKLLGHTNVSKHSLKLNENSIKETDKTTEEEEGQESDPIEMLVCNLLESPEYHLEKGAFGPQADVLKKLFKDAKQANNLVNKTPEEESRTDSKSKQVRNSVLGEPAGREYLLRTQVPYPSEMSKDMPQRLFAVILQNDFRMAGAITQDTIFC